MASLNSIPKTREELGGVSRSTVYRFINAGRLESVLVGRHRKIVDESLQRLIKELRETAGSA